MENHTEHDRLLDTIASWNADQFHESIVAFIRREKGLEEAVLSDLRKTGNTNAKDLFRDKPSGARKRRAIGRVEVTTFARLCQILAARGKPLPIAELLLGPMPQTMTADERLRNIEQKLDDSAVLERAVREAVQEEMDAALHKAAENIQERLRQETHAVLSGVAKRHNGYIDAESMRRIGEFAVHVRVMTTRLDLGAEWTADNVATPRGDFFRMTCERLRNVRHTFIVPDGATVINPDPFANRAITWPDRVDAMSRMYQRHGGIDRAHWQKNIVFRYTPLPIPASAAIFELSAEGFERLKLTSPRLVETLNSDPALYIQMPQSGTVFVGMGFSGAAVPHLTSLMSATSILFASNAFITYWRNLETRDQTTPTGEDSLVGLPTSPTTQYPAWPDPLPSGPSRRVPGSA